MNSLDNESNKIRDLLAKDDTALGQVYLAWHEFGEGEKLKDISNQSGIPYGTVAQKIQIIRQLLQSGNLPSTTSQCRTIAKDIRRFIDRASIDVPEEVLLKIDEIAKSLISRSEDPKLISQENRKNKEKANTFSQESGVYVYTYPHYRSHPAIESTDDTSERYHLKVGKTSRNPNDRVKEQTAGMPEDPMPLLLIVADDSNSSNIDDMEKEIHEHLEIIGHSKVRRNGGGKEWFLSNKETLISIAHLLRLNVKDPDSQ